MNTALHVSSWTSHVALANEPPYVALYGKDAHFAILRRIRGKAFVRVEATSRIQSIVPGRYPLQYSAWTESGCRNTIRRRGGYARAGTSFSSSRYLLRPSLTWRMFSMGESFRMTTTKTRGVTFEAIQSMKTPVHCLLTRSSETHLYVILSSIFEAASYDRSAPLYFRRPSS